MLEELLAEGELALAPQVLSEFIHVITDSRRFSNPLSMTAALDRAGHWWEAKEITAVFPNHESTQLYLQWMLRHGLGRKRLLATQLAAAYYTAGFKAIATINARDFLNFEGVSVRVPSTKS